MEKVTGIILNHPKLIITFFLLCTIICLIMSNYVTINYNILDYLPDTVNSTIALDIMYDEFGTDVPNIRFMVEDITIVEALELKEKLKQIENIHNVLWLDDAVNIYVPFDTIDKKTADSYYYNGNALFSAIAVGDVQEQGEAILKMRALTAGKTTAISGKAAEEYNISAATFEEIQKITFFSVLICLIILLLTSTSWIEPLIFLSTIGVAIAINMGTNIFFGDICFITNASASVLQLGVSIDYSIFLFHSYRDFKEAGMSETNAIKNAMRTSFKTISSSAITTMVGFTSFLFMKFALGANLGFVLLKGVTLSFICVFIFMPALMILTAKYIKKTQHKPLFKKFNFLGNTINKIKYITIAAFLILLIPAFLSSNMNYFLYGTSNMFKENTDISRESKLIDEIYGESNTYAIMIPRGDSAKEKQLNNDIKKIPQVSSIISYVEMAGAEIPVEFLDKSLISQLISDNYSRMIIDVKTESEGKEAFAIIEEMHLILQNYYGDEYYFTGSSPITYDLKTTIEIDNKVVNTISIIGLLITVLFTFKSISLPFIVVLVIQGAIWINLSFPYYMDQPVFYLAYLIISTLQLSATIDYAILFTDKYIYYRSKYNKRESIINTVANSTVSILTSASILMFAGFFMYFISINSLLSQLGLFICRGTIISFAFVIFILSGMLYIFDKPIQKTTFGLKFKNPKKGEILK